MSEETNPSGLSENGIAALSYISFIPAVIFLILPRYNRSAYVRFHAWQSLLLNVVAFLLSFIVTYMILPFMLHEAGILLAIVRIIWGIWLGAWVVWAVAALNGRKLAMPGIGKLADRVANPNF